jgi:MFS family permease
MLAILMILCGLTMSATGYFKSFAVLAGCRVLHAIFSSGLNPMSFSLLADYIPAEKRTAANSLLQSGNFIGWGISSLSVMAIK